MRFSMRAKPQAGKGKQTNDGQVAPIRPPNCLQPDKQLWSRSETTGKDVYRCTRANTNRQSLGSSSLALRPAQARAQRSKSKGRRAVRPGGSTAARRSASGQPRTQLRPRPTRRSTSRPFPRHSAVQVRSPACPPRREYSAAKTDVAGMGSTVDHPGSPSRTQPFVRPEGSTAGRVQKRPATGDLGRSLNSRASAEPMRVPPCRVVRTKVDSRTRGLASP